VLQLASSATFYGPLSLPEKSCSGSGSQWIVVTTNTPVPLQGTRITSSYFPSMAKILSKDARPAVLTQSGAGYYWFIGVEIGTTGTDALNYGVFIIGNGETTTAALPHHIFIDRCYVHGSPSGNIQRDIAANGEFIAVVDSVVTDAHYVGSDAQAIAAWNTPGPLKIVNDELEGSGENVLFGGAKAMIPEVVPSDLEIRHNHFFKPLTWRVGDPSYGGIHFTVKNSLEFKCADRVVVTGNIIDNNWADAQDGHSVLTTPRSNLHSTPQCGANNIEFGWNLLEHLSSAFNFAGEDNASPPSNVSAFLYIHDNLLVDIGAYGGAGGLLQIVNGGKGTSLLPPDDIIWDHNTAFQTGNVLTVGSNTINPIPGFTFTNSISPCNKNGMSGSGISPGLPTLAAYFVLPVVTANVLETCVAAKYPSGNFFPTSWTSVEFVDFADGNFELLPTSPYHNAGTDGKDIGPDIITLDSLINGVA